MTFALVQRFGIPTQRGFWLRCFLAKVSCATAVWLTASSLSWAKIEMPGPLHLWRVQGFWVNPLGKPLENVEVTLIQDGTVVHKTRTDESGRFAFDHVSGRFWLRIDKSDYSQLSREVIVGLETLTLLRKNTLYIIAGPGACTDDCSSVYTNKTDFERTIRHNNGHQR